MSAPVHTLGRYTVHAALASGGMATVHFGRLRGAVGFSRAVAIKRLLPQYAADPDFVTMFVDEARLASRIRHPNVVQTLDVVAEGGEISIVMEYVHGETLSRLIRAASEKGERVPPAVACRIARDMLAGLQAAHDATDERGQPLGIIHRDVSPQNVIVGADGIARLLDFGVAKARGRAQVTRDGQVKGKLSYMAPEQILGRPMTRSVDVFAAAVVLWETLACRRLFQAESEGHVVHRILEADVPSLGNIAADLARFDAVLAKGLARAPEDRFASARELAQALADVEPPAEDEVVRAWVEKTAGGSLTLRGDQLAAVERDSKPPESSSASAALTLPANDFGPPTGVTVRTLVSERHSDSERGAKRRRRVIVAGAAFALVCAAAIVVVRPRGESASNEPASRPRSDDTVVTLTPPVQVIPAAPSASPAPSLATAAPVASTPPTAPSPRTAAPPRRPSATTPPRPTTSPNIPDRL
ncbi:MAG: serine/threonine-protein kinase [Polyangiaceae bacterium]